MANGTIKKNVDVNRHTFAFSKTVAANAQIAYSVSAGDLAAPVGRNVRLVLVHQRGNAVQPCYVSWSLGTNIIQQSTNTIVSGYIYNPSGAERTYDLTVSAISTLGGVIARLHRAMSHRWRHESRYDTSEYPRNTCDTAIRHDSGEWQQRKRYGKYARWMDFPVLAVRNIKRMDWTCVSVRLDQCYNYILDYSRNINQRKKYCSIPSILPVTAFIPERGCA